MLPDGRRLGAHLPLADGMVRAADRAAAIGLDALQVFSDNPTTWRRRAGPSPEIPAFRERLTANGIAPLVIHASYLANLAGDVPAYHDRSIAILASELRSARRLGASLVNVHIGSHGGSGVEAGIAALVEAVRRALEAEDEPEDEPGTEPDESGPRDSDDGRDPVPSPRLADPGPGADRTDGLAAAIETSLDRPAEPVTIVLENSAGGGHGLGVDLDELAAIADALDRAGVPADRLGFCLDTAHAWGAGLDLSDPGVVDGFLAGFDRRIGLGRLPLVHLNDSRSELGSRSDRHEHVGAGRIGEAATTYLLRHPALAAATWVLETPGMEEGYDAINVARVRALARGEPPEPLPPEAFTLRGGRARAAAPPADPGIVTADAE